MAALQVEVLRNINHLFDTRKEIHHFVKVAWSGSFMRNQDRRYDKRIFENIL